MKNYNIFIILGCVALILGSVFTSSKLTTYSFGVALGFFISYLIISFIENEE